MSLKKIAVLSNVNMNFVIRMLKKDFEVYESEGYGNELGMMMNPASSYHAFEPGVTFLIMDLMEVIGHNLDRDRAEAAVDSWFSGLVSCIREDRIYYISDAFLWGPEMAVLADVSEKEMLESLWQVRLGELCGSRTNVYVFPYRALIGEMGAENAFSLKMWYLGKILHTNEAQKRMAALIGDKTVLLDRTPRKVLLLDLDNTLWGGLAGETDHTPVLLSEDHEGLAYKNLQRVIALMQRQGVILGIVSKNNEEDAMSILTDHPHQILRPEYFAAVRINWLPKHENIVSIAEELNLGLDSFVFFDDNPTERELVSVMLPQVAVPDFPGKPEALADAMVQIYKTYFEKTVITREDLEKTVQYAQNAKRTKLRESTGSFAEYLKQLEITVTREDPGANILRFTQLLNKTNQFNLTTLRFDQVQMQQILENPEKRCFLYSVADTFGDNGIVAAAIVDVSDDPFMEELVMSCRVMGKNIEYAVIEDVENSLSEEGYGTLGAKYVPTQKNQPVKLLYESAGYRVLEETKEGTKTYEICFADRPKREYYVKFIDGR